MKHSQKPKACVLCPKISVFEIELSLTVVTKQITQEM